MFEAVDLCCGFGGMSHGSHALGFQTKVAVDWNDKMCQLFQTQFPDIPVVHGDLGDVDTVVSIWQKAKGAAIGFVGFACQPYSRLGDSRSR